MSGLKLSLAFVHFRCLFKPYSVQLALLHMTGKSSLERIRFVERKIRKESVRLILDFALLKHHNSTRVPLDGRVF